MVNQESSLCLLTMVLLFATAFSIKQSNFHFFISPMHADLKEIGTYRTLLKHAIYSIYIVFVTP